MRSSAEFSISCLLMSLWICRNQGFQASTTELRSDPSNYTIRWWGWLLIIAGCILFPLIWYACERYIRLRKFRNKPAMEDTDVPMHFTDSDDDVGATIVTAC